MSNVEERIVKLETDMCWIKKMLQKIDNKLNELKQDQDSLKLKIMAMAGSVSVIITLVVEYILG